MEKSQGGEGHLRPAWCVVVCPVGLERSVSFLFKSKRDAKRFVYGCVYHGAKYRGPFSVKVEPDLLTLYECFHAYWKRATPLHYWIPMDSLFTAWDAYIAGVQNPVTLSALYGWLQYMARYTDKQYQKGRLKALMEFLGSCATDCKDLGDQI